MPGDDPGSMILTTAVGILDTAGDQRENAEKFVDFLLRREAQEYFAEETFEYPLRRASSRPSICRRSTRSKRRRSTSRTSAAAWNAHAS